MIRTVICSFTLTVFFCWTAPFGQAQQDSPRLEIVQEEAHAHSAELGRSVPASDRRANPITPVMPLHKPGGGSSGGGSSSGPWTDMDLQTSSAATQPGAPSVNFEGVGANGSIPPDANLAVGATQVVQIVNTEFQIFDKTGNTLRPPAAIHTIFTNLGGMCGTSDGGDPIVLHDSISDRWLISQLEYNQSLTTSSVCIAVSQTGDATGVYNLYAFNFGSSFPDYPKFGVWPDAYYMSANIFRNGNSFRGARACAFNRSAMLAGTAANGVCFQGNTSVYSLLPSDLDGGATAPPPAGAPNYFLQFAASNGVGNTLDVYKFHVDFTTTSNSTFTGPAPLSVATYHEACGGGSCVPQLGTTQQLDSLGDRLMYRLQYRNFPTKGYASLVVNQSVQVSSNSNQAGVRWYEIRVPAGGSPFVNQQSTFSPDASSYRWMASIAQDKCGDMAVGYSVSSAAINPDIYYTGRGSTDTPNAMASLEQLITNGTGSQTGYNRWGDYTSMAIDPADDSTFWYTNEYLTATGNFNWHTRIASFKFAACP